MSNSGHSHDGDINWELRFAIGSGVAWALGLIVELAGGPGWLSITSFLAAGFLGGYFTVKEAWGALAGRFDVDLLMVLAAVGAASIGKFGEGAVLLFLFSLGHALEESALAKATRSIEALAGLAPRTALRRTAGAGSEEVPLTQIQPGDVLLVRPNSRVPADGFLSLGASSLDQSAVTGESIPVEKAAVPDLARALAQPAAVAPVHQVFAGTVNGAGAFEMVATAAASDSTLARVVELVREAEAVKSPTQLFVERFQRWYVPAVLVAVVLVAAAGQFFTPESFADSFYRAILVLVAASPCALAIATPAAVLAGVARAARAGALVKGGAPLEALARVDAMAFDKTGTLTWGRPTLTDVVPAVGVEAALVSQVALAVEMLSDHPVAAALVRDLGLVVPVADRLSADDLVAHTGRGVSASIEGRDVMVGTALLIEERGGVVPADVLEVVNSLQNRGRTTMLIAREHVVLGVIGVMDAPRAESRPTLARLRAAGVGELVLISGDNQPVAQAVGLAVGADTAVGGLLPHDKVLAIQELSGRGRVTCMVGDGVNDAPAMAHAGLGIAMGAAGSSVALETADIALMADDLGRVPFLVRLGRQTSRIIRQNLFAALAVVAVLVPAALLGVEIGPIVILHEGSTIIVILNALRLLRFDVGREHHGIDHEERPA